MNIQRQVMKCLSLAWEGRGATSKGVSEHRGAAAGQARNLKAVSGRGGWT